MLEGEHCQAAHRMHRHLREDAIARLGQERHQNARAAIGDGQRKRRGEHPNDPRALAGRRRAGGPGERVGRPFEGERHGDGRELRQHEQDERDHHASLEIAAIRRPDIRPQIDERRNSPPPSGAMSGLSAGGFTSVAHGVGSRAGTRTRMGPFRYRRFRGRVHPSRQAGQLTGAGSREARERTRRAGLTEWLGSATCRR